MKSFGHYYLSLLLSGLVTTFANALESETCPPKYTKLMPTCALEGGIAPSKAFNCSTWESNGEAVCPNLRPYLPHKFQMVQKDGRDFLRYSGGSANLPESGNANGGTYEIVGENDISSMSSFATLSFPRKRGTMRMLWIAKKHSRCDHNIYRPGSELNGIKGDEPAFSLATDSWSFYHATHKHWHASNIYEFTLHNVDFDEATGKPMPSTEPLAKSNKVTFCLLDYVAAVKNNGNMGNSNGDNQQRWYWDCESHYSKLGISAGFIDQYHHTLDGMDFDMTNFIDFLADEDCQDFFVVVTVNGQCKYWETNYDDNIAYRGIRICKKGNGNSFNWHVDIIGNEYDSNTCCWDPEGNNPEMYQPHLCGEDISNH